jgi:hypothetical protein
MGDTGEEEERRQEDMFPGCLEAGAGSTNQRGALCVQPVTSNGCLQQYMHALGALEDTGQVQRARLEMASGRRRSELTITNSKLFQPPARERNGLSATRVRNKSLTAVCE